MESSWGVPVRMLEDAARLLGHSVSEIVPPEAQVHLLGAQRELLLALAITVEHNTGRGDDVAPLARSGAKGKATARKTARASRRPTKVAVD